MKKLLLASAIAALSVSTAQAAPTVYGKAFVKGQYMEDGDVTLDSSSSRIGLKGSEALTANTDVVYKLEYQIDVDSNQDVNGIAKSRDTYLGLSNKTMGTVLAGRLTAIDDMINFTNPSEYKDAGVLGSFDGDRLNNSLAFVSPDYSGVQYMAMYKLTDSSKGKEDAEGDLSGSFGVGAKYENGPLAAGVTYIKAEDTDKKDFDDIRVSGAYSMGDFTLSGLYQMIDMDGADETENSFIVAGEYDIPNSPWATYAEYDNGTNMGGKKDSDVDVFSVGGTYKFTKAATGHIFAGMTDKGDDNDYYGFGTGLEYKF